MRRLSHVFAGLCVCLIGLSCPCAAQTPDGTIDGIIRDSDHLPVSGVRVAASSPALIRQDVAVFSDGSGYYRLTGLPPGEYVLTFSLDGFQTVQRSGVITMTGRTTSIDVQLAPATVGASVTVVASESPTLDLRGGQLAFNIDSALTDNIPTSRDFNGLAATVPGVESASNYGVFAPGNMELQNVLGAGARANSYSLDGANTTDVAGQWNVAALFPYDIIEELQVVKGAKPAEIGYQGGLFSVVTKSGGNEFSGETGAYLQGDALQGDNAATTLRDTGVQTSNRLKHEYDISASLGGRLIRNKLWWYGSARRQDGTSTLFGFPADVTNEIDAFFWKNTYQPSARHRLTALATRWDQTVSHFFFNYSPALARDPQASVFRPISGETYSVRWNGILSDSLLAEASGSTTGQGLDQAFQPGAGVAVIDLITGERFRNSGEGSRDQHFTSWSYRFALSWFVPDTAGRHDFKVGGEYLPTNTGILFDDLGDHRLNVRRGEPFSVRILSTPSEATWDIDHFSLFAQDSWTIRDRLTLNLGVRFDRSHASTPEQSVGGGDFAGTALAARFPQLERTILAPTELVEWNDVAPRLAAVYSLDAEGRTVLRASVSRYYHFLESFGLFTSNPAFPFTFITLWNDLNGDRAFQVGEDGRLLSSFGGQISGVDPDLKRPYTNEFIVGVGHEPFAGVQLGASFIYRRDLRLTNTIDTGVPFDSYTPVNVLDPGEDGVRGSGDDGTLTVFAQDPATIGRSRIVLSNPPTSKRTYTGLELTAVKKLSNNWQAVASLVVSKMEVIKPTVAQATQGLYENPNTLINAKGRDPLNQTVQFKAQGSYFAPYAVVVSGFYRYLTGLPYTRTLLVEGLPQGPVTVFAEPRGSRTVDATNVIDLRVEKSFQLGSGGQFGLILDVFNLTNASTVIAEGAQTGVDLGKPQAIRNPVIARLGARFRW
jgi:outer membrane receptor protein involved in Fe transport